MRTRKSIAAAQIIEWVDEQIVAATKEANQPYATQQSIIRLAGRMEALLDVKQLCFDCLNRDNETN